MKKRPVRLAELVARVVGATTEGGGGRGAPGRRTFEVFRAFEQIGPPLTDHAEPSAFRKGRLTLRVRSPAWMTELSMMEGEIVQRVNRGLAKPLVVEVRLRLGTPGPRRAPRPPPAPPRLSPRQADQVAAWCAGLRNDAVRAAFEGAARRSLAAGPVGTPPAPGPAGPRVMPVPAWVDPRDFEPTLTYGYGDREFDRWTMKRAQDQGEDDEG